MIEYTVAAVMGIAAIIGLVGLIAITIIFSL